MVINKKVIIIIIVLVMILGIGIIFIELIRYYYIDKGAYVPSPPTLPEPIIDLLEDIRRGDKKLLLLSEEIVLEKGARIVSAIGVKNVESSNISFGFLICGIDQKTGMEFEPANVTDPITFWYNRKPNAHTLTPTESNVYRIDIRAPKKTETAIYKLYVYKDSEKGECGKIGNQTGAIKEIYAEKEFFVTVEEVSASKKR